MSRRRPHARGVDTRIIPVIYESRHSRYDIASGWVCRGMTTLIAALVALYFLGGLR